MPPRRSLDRLDDIAEACAAVERFCATADAGKLATDELLVAALLYQIAVIGEAAGHLPDAWKRDTPEVPWSEVVTMRNVLIHEYFRVDADVLWQTVRTDIPQLAAAVATMREAALSKKGESRDE